MRITVDLSRAYAAIKAVRMDDAKLQKLGERGAMMLFQDSSQSFIRQADPSTGEAWKPLKYKRRRGSTKRAQILMDTGRLRRSVATAYRVLGRAKLEILGGTRPLAYSRIHQFGGQAGRGLRSTIPARPYVGMRPTTRKRLQDLVTAYYRSLHG